MASFEVTLYGQFWVTPEDSGPPWRAISAGSALPHAGCIHQGRAYQQRAPV
jgi:hypothetical protein